MNRQPDFLHRLFASPAFIFILLLLPGLFLRVYHLADYASLPLLSSVTGPDVSEYHAHAMRILSGEFLPETVQIHAPLYAFFLALLLKFSAMGYFTARLLQCVLLMVFTALPVFLLLRKTWKEDTGEKRFLPYLSVLFLGLYPPLAVYQCELISEPLMIVLTLWGLFFAAMTEMSQRNTAFCLSGLFCALALITHPSSVIFCGGLFLFLLWNMRREKWKAILKSVFLFAIPLLCIVLPVSAWNTRIAGRPVFIQANSGFNYYLGNNPSATGTCCIPPGYLWEKVHGAADFEAKRSGISTDAYFLKEALHYMAHHPRHFLGGLVKKAAMALSGQEFTTWSDIAVLRELTLHRYAFQWCFSILLLLGLPVLLCGLAEPVFRNRMKWFILYFSAFYASQILFLTAGRYRLPLVVPLCVFAALFLCSLPDRFSSKRRTALWCAALLLTGIVTFCPYRRDVALEENYARTLLAEAWLRAGDTEKTEEQLAACSDHPLFNDRRYNLLGEVMLAKGEPDSAAMWFAKAVKEYPEQYQGYMNQGALLLDAKQWQEAERCFEKARTLANSDAGMADLDYNTGRLFHARGDTAKAKEYYRKALSLVPSHRKALNNFGTLALAEKDYAEAVRLFRKACALEPGNDRLRINLALANFLAGNKAEALNALHEALRLNPDSAQARFLLEDFQKN